MELFDSVLLFLFLRLLSCTLFLPGGYVIFPTTVRISLAFVLAVAFANLESVPHTASSNSLALLLLGEVLLGVFVALPYSLGCKVFFMFGSLIEQGRGQNLGGMYGAGTEQEGDGQLGKLFELGVLVAIVSSGLFLELVAALRESLSLIPPGTVSFHDGWTMFGREFVYFQIRLLLMSFSLFLPLGMLFVLCDLAIGLISKLVPGLPVFAELFIAKSAVFFLILLTVLVPSFEEMPEKAVLGARGVVKILFEKVGN